MFPPKLLANFRQAKRSKTPSGHALEGVDQARKRNLGRVLDQQVHVIGLVVGLQQFAFEVFAHRLPHLLQHIEHFLTDHATSILWCKD